MQIRQWVTQKHFWLIFVQIATFVTGGLAKLKCGHSSGMMFPAMVSLSQLTSMEPRQLLSSRPAIGVEKVTADSRIETLGAAGLPPKGALTEAHRLK